MATKIKTITRIQRIIFISRSIISFFLPYLEILLFLILIILLQISMKILIEVSLIEWEMMKNIQTNFSNFRFTLHFYHFYNIILSFSIVFLDIEVKKELLSIGSFENSESENMGRRGILSHIVNEFILSTK